MSNPGYTPLPDRTILIVRGEDAPGFLQGLITIDSEKLAEKTARYGCLLTPQGKYAYDFFLYRQGATEFWLDTAADRAGELMKRLRLFKLRSKVELALAEPPRTVFAVPGQQDTTPAIADGDESFADPRHAGLGYRIISGDPDATMPALEAAGLTKHPLGDYESLRLSLGMPEGDRDMQVDKSTMLECNIDQLGGVDWDKGCYMGQELTARTRYRGLVKKRLVPLTIDGPLPDYGTPVELDGKAVGETRSAFGNRALALMKLPGIEAGQAKDATFTIGDATASLALPDWLRIVPEEV